MFLTPKTVASTNRYVANSPENRNPAFRYGFRSSVEISGGILRYSTTSPSPDGQAKRLLKANPSAALMRGISQAGNRA